MSGSDPKNSPDRSGPVAGEQGADAPPRGAGSRQRIVPDRPLALRMLRQLYQIRHFETRVVELFGRGLIRGSVHVYLGEEAIAVGVCAALRRSDTITSTHRGHGHCIAKGGRLDKMMAEIFGKATGYCKGKGGSMHIADLDLGILGANGIVGAGVPVAVGAALTARIKKTDDVTVAFFGCGAANQGCVHEAMNMAAVWKLPVVFVIENNGFAVSVPQAVSTSVDRLAKRAAAYDMPGSTHDGNDVLEVYDAAVRAVERARRGEGPSLLEFLTYRWAGHYIGDPETTRDKSVLAEWKKKDPIPRFCRWLLEQRLASEAEIVSADKEAAEQVEHAVQYAQDSPFLDVSALGDDVYVEEGLVDPWPRLGAEIDPTGAAR